jgi:hypothetical protein
VDLLIQNTIDVHSDLTANSFDGTAISIPNASEVFSDLDAN